MLLSPDERFNLEKAVWSDKDFAKMGWHDVQMHAFTFELEKSELVFDLDYIFAWVNPKPPSAYYSFWIAPSTLVFHNAWALRSEMDEPPGGTSIMSVVREDGRPPLKYAQFAGIETEWKWVLDLLQGEMSFFASGYTQFTRRKPTHIESAQYFSLTERGGISFERTVIEL